MTVRLHPFTVTVHVVDAHDGRTIAEHLLPVDSPDAEHAAASTLANAASFTTKTRDGAALPIAFRVVWVEPRV